MSNYQVTQAVVQDLLKDKNTIIDKFNSNRIVSIPQDIKLELNEGTLILKAGSKVYVPNGFEADGTTPKFDVVVSEEDIFSNSSWTSGQVILIPQKGLTYGMYSSQISNHYSGSTEPATRFDGTIWYDTANNLIKRYSTSNSEWESGLPFPICISTMTSGVGLTSIDQVFNGFGYIGSTCYILPGITGYIPKGLNSDGTLINEITTQTKVSITTVTSSWGTGSELFFFNGIDSYIHRASKNCFYQATQPIVNDVDNYWYNTETGKFYETKNSGSSWSEFKAIPAFTITFDEGKITSLKSCGVHELVNSNATNLSDYGRQVISGLGMPSNKYIDLTLGASGATYTAPANGWFSINGIDNQNTATYNIVLRGTSPLVGRWFGTTTECSNKTAAWSSCILPCRKGDTVSLYYSANISSTSHIWRFYYSEGDQ